MGSSKEGWGEERGLKWVLKKFTRSRKDFATFEDRGVGLVVKNQKWTKAEWKEHETKNTD
jgi:hypothetical protein